MFKDYWINVAESTEVIGLDRARIQDSIDDIKSKLQDKPMSYIDKIIAMYNGFDELVFNMSENGKETIESIERMDVYRFYKYKQLLSKKINSNKNAV